MRYKYTFKDAKATRKKAKETNLDSGTEKKENTEYIRNHRKRAEKEKDARRPKSETMWQQAWRNVRHVIDVYFVFQVLFSIYSVTVYTM